jgi:hypothetical protein
MFRSVLHSDLETRVPAFSFSDLRVTSSARIVLIAKAAFPIILIGFADFRSYPTNRKSCLSENLYRISRHPIGYRTCIKHKVENIYVRCGLVDAYPYCHPVVNMKCCSVLDFLLRLCLCLDVNTYSKSQRLCVTLHWTIVSKHLTCITTNRMCHYAVFINEMLPEECKSHLSSA